MFVDESGVAADMASRYGRALIEGAGCRPLFLPPYCPDINVIEPTWSKLKTLRRGVGARTVGAPEAALSTGIDVITGADAAEFLRHCAIVL